MNSRREKEGFLTRWARRKQDSRRQEDLTLRDDNDRSKGSDLMSRQPQLASLANRDAEAAAKEMRQGHEPPLPEPETAEDLPVPEDLAEIDPETVDPQTLDYARLMRDDVPESLRRRLLRRLWEADEALANLDGLNDYDEDFTTEGIAAAAQAFFRQVTAISDEKQGSPNSSAEDGGHQKRKVDMRSSSSHETEEDNDRLMDADACPSSSKDIVPPEKRPESETG